MTFDFNECRRLFHHSVMDALVANADRLRALASDEPAGIDAISFDILPWHRYACLSFRASDDNFTAGVGDNQIDIRYSPADWKYYEFIDDASLEPVRNFLGNVYPEAGGTVAQEVVAMLLLAAADALLDDSVGTRLEELGLHCAAREHDLGFSGFEYVVIDDDKTIGANYCDIALVNRVARRMMKESP